MAAALDITIEQAEAILCQDGIPSEYLSDADVARMFQRLSATIETERAPIQELGGDKNKATSELNEAAHPESLRLPHAGNPAAFALAAADSTPNPTSPPDQFFPVTTEAVSIDGVLHEFVTNGDDVFVVLRERRSEASLRFDNSPVSLQISSDNTKALLVDYGRGKLLNFLDRMKREPGQHAIRWADPGRSDQHD